MSRLGVLAFGDSITNGGGELQWGVALQSWALWVARGLGLPFTTYAVDGARAADVAREQVPALRSRTAHPDARYDLGCLYVGVNDVRAPDWDPRPSRPTTPPRCEHAGGALRPHAAWSRSRSTSGARARARASSEANAIVERGARGALVLDLRGFGARNLVMIDHVHPTAFGQVWIAERALDVLAADGMDVRVRPSTLIAPGERHAPAARCRATGPTSTGGSRSRLGLLWGAGRARRAARAASARSDSSRT